MYAAQPTRRIGQSVPESHPPLLDLASRIAEEARSIQLSTKTQLQTLTNPDELSLNVVESFFAAAGFSTTRIDERSFEITAAKGTLAKFVPISGRIAKDKHLENDILDLEEMTASSSPGQRLGFLIYDNLPDTLSRIKMADVRLRNDFFVIPLRSDS